MNDSMRQDAISRVGITIAIDGPAGSGKSTVSKALAPHRLPRHGRDVPCAHVVLPGSRHRFG